MNLIQFIERYLAIWDDGNDANESLCYPNNACKSFFFNLSHLGANEDEIYQVLEESKADSWSCTYMHCHSCFHEKMKAKRKINTRSANLVLLMRFNLSEQMLSLRMFVEKSTSLDRGHSNQKAEQIEISCPFIQFCSCY